ncbi:MAG: precorrin-4 C(11)-methyltransferase [Proteobacteria bacterium]|nr:precorrin-4 C(11)-methyltransferase [Pseudomonadota bacterium]
MGKKRNARSKKLPVRGMVYFIGAGPGDPELITIRGNKIIKTADLIIYAGSLVNPLILADARADARIMDSSSLTLHEIAGALVKAARQGKTVARVHTGDPSVYGAIAEQIAVLKKEKIPHEVIPGVSSAFAAAASLKKEFTVPGVSQTLIMSRRAGRTSVPERESLASLAAHRSSMAIFLSVNMLEEAVRELIDGGYPQDTPAAVVYRASWPDETVIRGKLSTIAAKVGKEKIRRQAIILVGDVLGETIGEPSRLYASEFKHGFRPAIKGNKNRTAVIAVTRDGAAIGRTILNSIRDAYLFLPEALHKECKGSRISYYDSLAETMEMLFQTRTRVVCIMAAGIAVRMIAPCVKSKWEDPAVVVIDDRGKHVISLLSGHWGGANELAQKLAKLLNGTCVITTASDVRGFPALDLLIKRLGSDGFSKKTLRKIQTNMIGGRPTGFYPAQLRALPGMEEHDNLSFYNSVDELCASGCSAGVVFSHETPSRYAVNERFLFAHPKDIVVGIGCNRGVSAREISESLGTVLNNRGLPLSAIRLMCTSAVKKDEKGLITFAQEQGIPLRFFSPAELNSVPVPSKESPVARRVLGVQGVAEPAAILGSQRGELILNKVKTKNITLALARMAFAVLIRESREDARE